MNEFDALLDEQRAIKATFQSKAQELFKKTTAEIFEKVPQLNAIRWTQYTPYFNDGDTCEFSVGDPYFTNAEGDELEDLTSYGEYDGEGDHIWCAETYTLRSDSSYSQSTRDLAALTHPQLIALEKFAVLIQSEEMQDVMLAMFDDHVCVTATRDGFDVDEYSHD